LLTVPWSAQCGGAARGTTRNGAFHVCGPNCAQTIGDEHPNARPLPAGLYIQGDKANEWFPAQDWQRELYWTGRDHEGQRGGPGDIEVFATHRGFEYILRIPFNGPWLLQNKKTGATRMFYLQPDAPIPPTHSGASSK